MAMDRGAFLSLCSLTKTDFVARQITDTYSIHRVVYSLFHKYRELKPRILFAEKGRKGDLYQILILSEFAPEKPFLKEDEQKRYKKFQNPETGLIETKIFPDSGLNHEKYRFEIIINPAKTVGGKTSRTVVPIPRNDVLEWFTQKSLSSWGFSPFELDLRNLKVDKFVRRDKKCSRSIPVTLAKALITGFLTVTDRELFKESFYKGFGRGKTFGCGLLQLSLN